ncbi:helix-turn-helix domain-containing protein [Serratia silvae]|uniref:Helix-turn-helix domain-containing protein n=1 Tax=Serratia silvae TaxID=2824122 RepID=A0ABT0KA21_9GAMM|nr:helix-turn-helix domain-containing protein [Serratia silvae]MCL1028801.1 helix-turn-helix domain-containing protein [Serratia silvae]
MKRITTSSCLGFDEVISLNCPGLLLINSTGESVVAASSKNKYDEHLLSAGSTYLLVADSAKIEVLQGEIHYRELDCSRLVKLQVFLDQAATESVDFSRADLSAVLATTLDKQSETRSIEYWYVNQVLNSGPEQKKFVAVLRNTEWYQLICFLLAESEDVLGNRIQDMCVKYGLSLAHFRRLSRNALGKSTKVGLRDWRLIRALLELSGGDKNMTTIAMDHGYSSLSHFSYEVKNTFGISARNMKQIITDG